MNLEVIVLSPELEPIGLINKMTALRWTGRFNSIGDFELWCPLTPENAEMLKEENLVWIGTEALGVIETIQEQKDSDGGITLQVSGRFNECWLKRRIVWHMYAGTGYVSNHMRSLVNANAINPTEEERKIPLIVLNDDQDILGPSVSYNAHRDNLWESLDNLGTANRLSPRLLNDVINRRCVFTVKAGIDRSLEQTTNDPVILSSELSDILSFDYSSDSTDFSNCAQVAGAGEGANRKEAHINTDLSGLNRRELAVDARDISDTESWGRKTTTTTTILKTRTDDSGNEDEWMVKIDVSKVLTHPDTGETRITNTSTTEWVGSRPIEGTSVVKDTEEVYFSDAVYTGMLAERGNAKLAEKARVEEFNSQIRVQGSCAYVYGKDYFLGDRVTVIDTDLRIQISTEITEVEESWDEEEYSVYLTLGKAAPTIKSLIQRS